MNTKKPTMKNDPKEKPEKVEVPKTNPDTPIPPEFIPEPKKHETIPSPEKEKNPKECETLKYWNLFFE